MDAKTTHLGGDGRPRGYSLGDYLFVVHVTGEETEGHCCVIEHVMAPGASTPLHAHRDDSETIYVLEGEVTVYWPGGSRRYRRGQSHHQRARVPHTVSVSSAVPARVLTVNAPPGFDRFVAAAGQPTDTLALGPGPQPAPDMERLVRVADEHGIDIIGPPGALPGLDPYRPGGSS